MQFVYVFIFEFSSSLPIPFCWVIFEAFRFRAIFVLNTSTYYAFAWQQSDWKRPWNVIRKQCHEIQRLAKELSDAFAWYSIIFHCWSLKKIHCKGEIREMHFAVLCSIVFNRTCIFTEGFFVRNISAPILMLQSYSLLALPILVSIEFEYKGCCFCLAFVAVIRDDQTISGHFASNGHYT